jgi:hypothetical protein
MPATTSGASIAMVIDSWKSSASCAARPRGSRISPNRSATNQTLLYVVVDARVQKIVTDPISEMLPMCRRPTRPEPDRGRSLRGPPQGHCPQRYLRRHVPGVLVGQLHDAVQCLCFRHCKCYTSHVLAHSVQRIESRCLSRYPGYLLRICNAYLWQC